MHWLPLTLICALSLATADAVTKGWLQGLAARDLSVIRFGLAGLLTLPLVLLNPPDWPAPAFWGWIAWLVPLELLALVLYMQAIRDYPLSLTLPYLAFTPVFVTLTGWLILGETLSAGGMAGILLVVAGSWLLHFRTWTRAGLGEAVLAPFHHPGSRRMLGVALIYALTSVGGKGAMRYMPPEQFGPLYVVLIGAGAMLLFQGWERAPRVLRTRPWPALTVALLMGVMILTHFLALEQVETAYMIAVKRTSLVFGVIYGLILFGESQPGARLIAGAIMLAGVGMILRG